MIWSLLFLRPIPAHITSNLLLPSELFSHFKVALSHHFSFFFFFSISDLLIASLRALSDRLWPRTNHSCTGSTEPLSLFTALIIFHHAGANKMSLIGIVKIFVCFHKQVCKTQCIGYFYNITPSTAKTYKTWIVQKRAELCLFFFKSRMCVEC